MTLVNLALQRRIQLHHPLENIGTLQCIRQWLHLFSTFFRSIHLSFITTVPTYQRRVAGFGAYAIWLWISTPWKDMHVLDTTEGTLCRHSENMQTTYKTLLLAFWNLRPSFYESLMLHCTTLPMCMENCKYPTSWETTKNKCFSLSTWMSVFSKTWV